MSPLRRVVYCGFGRLAGRAGPRRVGRLLPAAWRSTASFAERKSNTLAKSDKSAKGAVDAPVVSILGLLNAKQRIFTTSSCSGRCYFWQGLEILSKREILERARETHEVPCEAYLDLGEEFLGGWWWLRFEPFIIHIRCEDLDAAAELLRLARSAGIKQAAVESLGVHPTVCLRGEEFLEMPLVINGVRVLNGEQRPALLVALRQKFQNNLERLTRLEAALRESLVEEVDNGIVRATSESVAPLVLGSYELIGDIIVLKRRFQPEDLQTTADQVLAALPRARTVAIPTGTVSQESRAAPLEVVRGGPELCTRHMENGISLDIDLSTCFFSPAMALERKRIASSVRPGDAVLELFAGIGAQAILIAMTARRNRPDSNSVRVDCVDSNVTAANLCRANIERNRVAECVRVFETDVLDFVPPDDRSEGYNVVLCPRPEVDNLFLVEALRWVRPGGRLHWYFCGTTGDLDVALSRGHAEVQADCGQQKRRCLREVARRRVPRRSIGHKGRYRWCVDFEVEEIT